MWVVDFPLVEWNEDHKRWDSLHHPFTAPNPEDLETLLSQTRGQADAPVCSAMAYDLVLNGS